MSETGAAAAGQHAPGTVWVAFILGLVGLVQQLWPEGQFPLVAGVVLVGNFLAGLIELYTPTLKARRREGGRAQAAEAPGALFDLDYAGEQAPRNMTHAQALKKLLIGG